MTETTTNDPAFELFCDEQGFDYGSTDPEAQAEVRAARLAWNAALASRAAIPDAAQAPVTREATTVPEGWRIGLFDDGAAVVEKTGLGGVVCKADDESIASAILRALVGDMLAAAPASTADDSETIPRESEGGYCQARANGEECNCASACARWVAASGVAKGEAEK